MAEGVLEDLLGEAEEAPEAASEAAQRASAEAFAASLAADHAKHDPAVARSAKRFLDRQAHLLELQARELVQQSEHRLSHLIDQGHEGRLRRTGQRLRLGMQALVAVAVLLLVLGAVVMVIDAFTSRQVVVEAFRAPPALAARGVTGDVVAAGVLDTLRKLQDATRLPDKTLSAKGAWASDVKIEVPETGVSIGEIIRLLHQRFGHDLHIDGELTLTGAGGLEFTVRGDGVPAATFAGGPEDLAKLTTEAAEYIYGRAQAPQYATYLVNRGRYADADTFIQDAFPRAADDLQRAQLANTWGNAYASQFQSAAAMEKYRLAMTFARPGSDQWWKSWGNRVGAVSSALGEEAGWREAQRMLEAVGGAHAKVKRTYLANPAQLSWDLPLLLGTELDDAKHHGGAGASTIIEGPSIADSYALMHDFGQAARYMASSDPSDPVTKAEALLLSGYAALDREDYAAAVPPLEGFDKAWLADPNLQYTFNTGPCLTGLAIGMTGRVKEAEAIFKRLPWSFCYAYWGDVLVHAGDVAGAGKVWAAGQRVSPDLPAVPLHRGLYELSLGQLKAAETEVAAASAKAPHWADPLKVWGDVLAREGRWKEALTKYDAALRYAPAWAELHQARAIAAGRTR